MSGRRVRGVSRMSASVDVGRNDEVISVDQDAGGRGRWTEDPTAQLGEEVRPHAVSAESIDRERERARERERERECVCVCVRERERE